MNMAGKIKQTVFLIYHKISSQESTRVRANYYFFIIISKDYDGLKIATRFCQEQKKTPKSKILP